MKKILVLIIVFGFLLSACAGANLRTMQRQQAGRVDPISITDSEKYDRDFNECAKYAADWLTRAQNEALARALAWCIGWGWSWCGYRICIWRTSWGKIWSRSWCYLWWTRWSGINTSIFQPSIWKLHAESWLCFIVVTNSGRAAEG